MSIIKQIKDSNNNTHDIHALKATNDGDGNTISSTYAKLGEDNYFTESNIFDNSVTFNNGITVFGDTIFEGNIVQTSGSIETPVLHVALRGADGTINSEGGKIIFGDYGEDIDNHEDHIVCIEEINDDELTFTADCGCVFKGGGIICEDGDIKVNTGGKVETPTLYLNTGGFFGGKIVFGDYDGDIDTHYSEEDGTGHYCCIEEIKDDELTFRAGSGFTFEGGKILCYDGFIGGNIDLKNTILNNNIQHTSDWTIKNDIGALRINYNYSNSTSSNIVSVPDIIKFDNVREEELEDSVYCDIHVNGAIITRGNDSCVLMPSINNCDMIGSASHKFWKMYATTFHGDLSGTATHVDIDAYTANSNYPLVFANNSGGSNYNNSKLGIGGSTSTANIYYNPSTNKLIGLDGISSHSVNASNGYGFELNGRSSSPYIRLCEGQKSLYVQTSSGIGYFGMSKNNSLSIDVVGNVSVPGDLTVNGETNLDYLHADSIDVAGAVNAGSGFYETSDGRLKDIIKPLTVDLNNLSKLQKVYFNWKDKEKYGDGTQLGMIAQEVQEIYPELVYETDGQLSLAYDKLSVIALEAIDVLHNENNELKNSIDVLHNENNELKYRIDKLESLFNNHCLIN